MHASDHAIARISVSHATYLLVKSAQKIAVWTCCVLVDSAFIHLARHALLQLGNRPSSNAKACLASERPLWLNRKSQKQ